MDVGAVGGAAGVLRLVPLVCAAGSTAGGGDGAGGIGAAGGGVAPLPLPCGVAARGRWQTAARQTVAPREEAGP